jgi:hypothetical protein
MQQRFGDRQRLRGAASPDHGQLATVLDAVDFEDHCVAGVAFNRDLRLRAWART